MATLLHTANRRQKCPLTATVLLAAVLLAAVLLAGGPALANGAPGVVDDAGRTLALSTPARRIVSLAPHATELLYAAGAGEQVVGVSEFSDYPQKARQVPRIGGGGALDLERIVALKPDLVVAWRSGNSAVQIARLKNLGIPIFESEPRDFAAIASNIERLAQLAGTETAGHAAASAFRARLDLLSTRFAGRAPVRVFYQVWDKPLMTLNGQHMVSAVMRLCGGRNIFDSLPQLAPMVGVEAVVRADPEVIMGDSAERNNAPSAWRRFPKMTAVERGNLFVIDPDLLTRPGPRIIDGAEQMCQQLETARSKRP
ncbi:cobalamin-binding protein [Noviherbaspirillum sedimenti]|uniref:Cobalamin-binding protein n=1 Tax=Noviherbaspirillum sedimenti TaxID=2320865 RepID=A0A3A3G1E5_9BURK|nr:cobalamin-binding protein [Noviherbaspirillum sedimenti]RJG01455.1 cobalamin-binding protein [Noviherbaspirillum sedimenti]